MKKKIADQTTGRHTFVEIHELRYKNGKRVVMFEIPPAPQGIPIYQGHYYGRDGESLQALSMDKIERIRNQAKLKDWSAEIIEEALLEDLDSAAIVSCPFILAVDRIYDKIRNLKYRYINPEHKTLFPEEIDTYEPYVIREALNNAIAHQDYMLGGQINVVEYDDKLVFSNKGSFIPGNIDGCLSTMRRKKTTGISFW